MAQADPNTCPHCGSPSTAVTFGFNPQRMNNDETINGFVDAINKNG